MVSAVIFDFDMTLVNSLAAITRGLNLMAEHFSLPRVTEDDTRRVMALEAKLFWRNLWGCHDEAWNGFFLEVVADQEKDHLKLAGGAEELLTGLKASGRSLGLATNRDNAWKALVSAGLARHFDTAVGSREVSEGKPAPDMLYLALDQLQADPGQTIYVGDSVSDMQAAVRAGLRAVGVLEGGAGRDELMKAGAWQIRENLPEVGKLIEAI